MYKTYKPSGKLSFAFFPITFFMLLLAVPSISFLYVLATWYSPSKILDIVIYVLTILLLPKFWYESCIVSGKVRNSKVATFCGIVTYCAYSYLSIVFYYAFKLGEKGTVKFLFWNITKTDFSLTNFLTALMQPGNAVAALAEVVETGFSVRFFRGNVVLTLNEGFLAVIWCILFLATLFYVTYCFNSESKEPFCEASKKWGKKITLHFQYIEDSDALLQSLMFGDTRNLESMEGQGDINCSHSEVVLYVMEGGSDYYISIYNKKLKEDESSKHDDPEFDSEDITEKLLIDRETAQTLRYMSKNSSNAVSSNRINLTGESSGRPKLLSMFLFFMIHVSLIAFAFIEWDSVKIIFSNGIVLFYMALSFFIYLLNMIGSFTEDDKIIEDETQYSSYVTSLSPVESKNSKLGYKLYYFIMMILSLVMLLYCLMESF